MSRKLRNLSTKELENILQHWEDSEDALDFFDDDDTVNLIYNLEGNEDCSSDGELEAPSDLQIVLESTDSLQTAPSKHHCWKRFLFKII